MTRFLAVEYLALVIGTLLPIMNPFSTAPLFIALSSGRTAADRNRQAMLACIYSFCILVTFLLAGRAIIQFFGISLPGIRVAGGLLIASLGFRMVFGSSDVTAEGAAQPSRGDIAFTPLAMPSLSGPGSISVVLTMSSEVPTNMLVNGHVVVIIGIAITCAIAWIVLRLSTALIKLVGRAGMDALTRIFGFLLVAIAMQFLLGGIADFYSTRFPSLFHATLPS